MVIGFRMGAAWQAVERRTTLNEPGQAAVTMPGPVKCDPTTPLDHPSSVAGSRDPEGRCY
jgi:hypothetical protein